jgi:hypothetical protein
MVDCVVCRYWSERLDEAKVRNKREANEEKRVIAALRTHQSGACACRFPRLLKDLVKHQLKVPDKTPEVCDPVRIRILIATL